MTQPVQRDPVLTDEVKQLISSAFSNWMEVPLEFKSSLKAWLEQEDSLSLGVGQVYGLQSKLNVTTTALATAGRSGFGIALPVSPTDKQQFILTDNVATPSWWWDLYYVGALGKWICLGGMPALSTVTADESPGSTGAWVNLATAGPQFTVPVAGSYLCDGDCVVANTSGGIQGVQIGVALNNGTPGYASPTNHFVGSRSATRTRTVVGGAAVSDVIKLRYFSSSTLSLSFGWRQLSVIPAMIG